VKAKVHARTSKVAVAVPAIARAEKTTVTVELGPGGHARRARLDGERFDRQGGQAQHRQEALTERTCVARSAARFPSGRFCVARQTDREIGPLAPAMQDAELKRAISGPALLASSVLRSVAESMPLWLLGVTPRITALPGWRVGG
jgi:hypothetical protein